MERAVILICSRWRQRFSTLRSQRPDLWCAGESTGTPHLARRRHSRRQNRRPTAARGAHRSSSDDRIGSAENQAGDSPRGGRHCGSFISKGEVPNLRSAFLKREHSKQGRRFKSERSQGKPKQPKDDIPDNVKSRMGGDFTLENSILTLPDLQFEMPGTRVNLEGSYSLDGNQFDFHGHARFDAKLSQMVGGWKSVFLKPVDPFFSKHGAGTELPVKITGTKSEPHFGLDFSKRNRKQHLLRESKSPAEKRHAIPPV